MVHVGGSGSVTYSIDVLQELGAVNTGAGRPLFTLTACINVKARFPLKARFRPKARFSLKAPGPSREPLATLQELRPGDQNGRNLKGHEDGQQGSNQMFVLHLYLTSFYTNIKNILNISLVWYQLIPFQNVKYYKFISLLSISNS